MKENKITKGNEVEERRNYNDLPREYSNRSSGKCIRNLYSSTPVKDFIMMVKNEYLIAQVEAMNNERKVQLAAYCHTMIDGKFKGVYDGVVKGVGEYARLYGDKDYKTAGYLELNKRFRLRVCPYLMIRQMLSSDLLEPKELMNEIVSFFSDRYDADSDFIDDYTIPISITELKRRMSLKKYCMVKFIFDGKRAPWFMNTEPQWRWVIDSGKPFFAFLEKRN